MSASIIDRTYSPLLDRKIETATDGLNDEYRRCFTKLSQDNAVITAGYILSVKSEANLSDNYRKSIIKTLSTFSVFCKNKSFKSMTRQDLLSFLDSYRKAESIDPMHKWIGTYNLYNIILIRFSNGFIILIFHLKLGQNLRLSKIFVP
jgi:hypothetical protein